MLNRTSERNIPYLIKNNFLSDSQLSMVLSEIKRNRTGFSRDGYNHKRTIRDEMDPRYCGTQVITNPRNILYSIWQKHFWKELQEEFENTNDFAFIHSSFIREGSVLLSSYGNGDSYGEHIDIDLDTIVTCVLFLSFNHSFTGGDLVIDNEVIPFKNNKLIIFPSCAPHSVTKIGLGSSKFEDRRFSLQYFISPVKAKIKLIDESSNK